MNSGSSVYTIDTGKSRGTTFKIDTGGYVFSCLFDSGAEISCMNMETVATLGLTSQITPSSVSVNTANGDHMGVAGDVRVHFKIGKKCSFTYSFVVCKRLSHLFIIGEDFMKKHYMSLQWVLDVLYTNNNNAILLYIAWHDGKAFYCCARAVQ